MKELKDRVAAVTGAGSGIGRALALRFAGEGMRVVIADVEKSALVETEEQLLEREADVLAVQTDVSVYPEVDELARQAFDHFGAVHVLCNNAGVGGSRGQAWELTLEDWEWTLGVNLMGVIHGVRAFLPRMLERGEEGHVVNTGSVAGLLSGAVGAPYTVSKFGVVALSETLHHELTAAGSKVRVSVLCPGLVATRIIDSARNRPARLGGQTADSLSDEEQALRDAMRAMMAGGMPPDQVAEQVVEAVRAEQFYILTHTDFDDRIRDRIEHILERRDPTALAIRRELQPQARSGAGAGER